MRTFVAGVALIAGMTSAAQADVRFCNKTGRTLQFVVGAHVTTPYVTKDLSGWHTVAAGQCRAILKGDYKGVPVYWAATFSGGGDYTMDGGETFTFCIKDQAFTRRGSWDFLQKTCPSEPGWYKRANFYEVVIKSSDHTLNFWD